MLVPTLHAWGRPLFLEIETFHRCGIKCHPSIGMTLMRTMGHSRAWTFELYLREQFRLGTTMLHLVSNLGTEIYPVYFLDSGNKYRMTEYQDQSALKFVYVVQSSIDQPCQL